MRSHPVLVVLVLAIRAASPGTGAPATSTATAPAADASAARSAPASNPSAASSAPAPDPSAARSAPAPDPSASRSAPGSNPSAARPAPAAVALPGAPPDGVMLDYLAVDRARDRIWVPAGGTGRTVVIDAKSLKVNLVEKFPTAEVERRGRKRTVGPSSATIGDGVVYVGNRGDSSVCAVDATSLERGGCVTLTSSPDGVAYVAKKKEVWVTTPRDQSIAILDVSKPMAPKLAGSFKLDGQPEGFAVDNGRGVFYTNLEDKDRTLQIDVASRKVIATWMPSCGEGGPKGLALEPSGSLLMVACPDHVEVLDAAKGGGILSKLDTGDGVDNIDYLPAQRRLYAAAAGAAALTVARLDEKGALHLVAPASPTAKGARNAVVTSDGTAYVADGPEGRVLVVKPAKGE